ncbi:MAG: hypothetical protein ILP02_03310, partial [Clostridia bacterium]|nr:hypothetical protein [Clostridia bacterium]
IYRPSAALIAISLSALLSAVVYAFSARRRAAKESVVGDKLVARYMHVFNVRTYDENSRFFCEVFNELHISAYVTDAHVTISDKIIVVCAFFPSPVDDDLLKTITDGVRKNDKTIVVMSSGYTERAANYAKATGMVLYGARAVYDLLSSAKKLPVLSEKKSPLVSGDAVKRFFRRTNGVRLILFGLSLVVFGFAVFYPVYYYVSGGALTLSGLAALIFGGSEKPEKTDLLTDLRRFCN